MKCEWSPPTNVTRCSVFSFPFSFNSLSSQNHSFVTYFSFSFTPFPHFLFSIYPSLTFPLPDFIPREGNKPKWVARNEHYYSSVWVLLQLMRVGCERENKKVKNGSQSRTTRIQREKDKEHYSHNGEIIMISSRKEKEETEVRQSPASRDRYQ